MLGLALLRVWRLGGGVCEMESQHGVIPSHAVLVCSVQVGRMRCWTTGLVCLVVVERGGAVDW